MGSWMRVYIRIHGGDLAHAAETRGQYMFASGRARVGSTRGRREPNIMA